MNDYDNSPEGIARYLARNPRTCFVAETDGKVVGVILCGNDGRRGYIHNMAVAESHQREGIGTALVDAAVSALLNEGIPKVGLVAFITNENGNAFWEKQGFIIRSDLFYRNKQIRE
jgi:ribosomal protein S18 acetylase RimI-like enzyme